MSELITTCSRTDMRWQLLATASAVALMGYIAVMPVAQAEESDSPTVWIELGGQLSRVENGQETYAPPFVALTPSNLSSPPKAERPARYGFDGSAALTIQPQGSDWKFSASLRYGRSGNSKRAHQQSNPPSFTASGHQHRSSYGVYFHKTLYHKIAPIAARFTDVAATQSESHNIVDFQVGKDFGIGLFGHNATSILDVGTRFAQFTSKSRINLREDPDWQFVPHTTGFSTAYIYNGSFYSFYRKSRIADQPFHSFSGALQASRSFSGLGPTISWKSSEGFVGNSQDRELTFDWGINASLLFGRQKAKIHHQTTGRFHSSYATRYARPITYQRPVTPDRTRSRDIVVPNIGGFAGFSVKYPKAKVSFGYKADFFFGAMDGGIDVRRTEDVGFHGPYASVSIGLGG